MEIPIVTGEMHMEKLEVDEGYAELHMGTAEVATRFQYILHQINIQQIADSVNQFANNIPSLIPPSYQELMLKEIDEIKDGLHTLLPGRVKRGLLNIGGKLMKWIYGTVDDDDRQQINQHFEVVDSNNHQIIEQSNHQVHINDRFNSSINKLVKAINENRAALNSLTLAKQVSEAQHHRDVAIFQLFKLMDIKSQMRIIQESIALAKMKIFNPALLTKTEIENYKINVEAVQDMQMGVALHKYTTLMFVIKIPIETMTLKKSLITPIPNKSFHQIDITREYVVKTSKGIFSYNGEKDFKNLKPSRNCVFCGKCGLISHEAETVDLIEEGTIIITNANKAPMTTNCDDRRLNLTGNYLISFYNCTVRIREQDFASQLVDVTQKFLMVGNNRSLTTAIKPTLEKLQVTQISNIKTIKELRFQQTISNGITYSAITITGIAVIIIILLLCKSRREVKIRINNKLPERNPNLNRIVENCLEDHSHL